MKFTYLALALGISFTLSAQEAVLFSVDGEPVTVEEFSYVYNKNKDIGRDIDPKTPREYLDLYINFKLKVHEAEMMGMDTTRKFTREFNSYQEQLARPYMTLKEVNEEVLQEAYQHMHWDIRARHIMLDLAPDALPEDTLKVYNELMTIRQQILDGQRTFESAAKAISTDTYSARQGGDLGWFTAFNMVYPFEKMAYELEPGEISKPVRTEYGYHIIEATDRRYSRGKIEVAHILAYAAEGASEEEMAAAERKINEIYAKLEAGEDFATLARQHSDDKTTATKGGVLPAFGMREMLPEFEEISFGLAEDGDLSVPFKTKIGWHIVKRIHRYELEPFENMKDELIQKIGRDSRSNLGERVFIQQLKKEYEFTVHEEALMEVINSVGDEFNEGTWDASEFSDSKEVVYSFADREITQGELAKHLNEIQQRKRSSNDNRARVYGLSQDYAKNQLLAYEKAHLAEKYPDFRHLVNEYREGILLFDLTQEKIWNKSAADSAGLAEFYSNHTDNYVVGPRYHAVRVTASSEDIADDVLEDLEDGMSGSDILKKYNQSSELTVRVDTMKIAFDQNAELHEEAEGEEGAYGVWEKDARWTTFGVFDIIPEGPREFKEIKGIVTSDYQKYLETQWVEELREKYEVEVNEEVMEDLESEL
ncbi:MAG: hypothetical protein EP346_04250 [Bacteroidetes bacterium]|nr:MAG: hypothetical protein EP346_04250 [Bacteroidota bacterium]